MSQPKPRVSSITNAWKLARSGDLRGGAEAARAALSQMGPRAAPDARVDLHLVSAFCAMRQGHHAEALRELDVARAASAAPRVDAKSALHAETWCAELAYLQGRYSEANDTITRVLPQLESCGDWAYVAFALRVRIAILLARHPRRRSQRRRLRAGADLEYSGCGAF